MSTRRMDDTGLDRIAQFARQEIGPYLAAHPEDRYPLPLVRQLAQLGAFGAAVPTQYGGGDWSRRDLALIGYELGRGWQPLAALVGTHLKLCRQVTQHGTPRQRERWLDAMARGESVFARAYHEQGIGHPSQLRTRATRRGRAAVLNGRKSWVTNARNADRVLAIARGDNATMGVLVDPARPGVTVGPELPRPGLLGVSLAEITFHDYEFDPEEDVLGGWGHDLTASLLAHDVTSYTARAVGSADAVLEHAVRFVRDGLTHRPADVQGAIRLRTGELAAKVAVMRTVWRALLDPRPPEDGTPPGAPNPPMTSAVAKVFCTTTLLDVLREAAALCGGAGYAAADHALGRHYRDALALPIIGAPNDVLLSRIGEHELGADRSSGPVPDPYPDR
ncbi:alkylation response protein AidB-like acyl-CoA dehydrogenase [Kitasatospora sp. GAS204A]|uniref:acyl-CoA dehydrogenase family protein n=1 Tax=unclassified Kitasatospora TaxID=2633591 RepID=UPI0024766464|nr:acyl-CoA dehydrogenase family protein [Kitasatospora sp. GAS204B]MDH6115820.1 alkylation response protein AidB-like acyl-CoA dehydrogenase [Kitasatospora sp. GAS204B]